MRNIIVGHDEHVVDGLRRNAIDLLVKLLVSSTKYVCDDFKKIKFLII